MTEKKWYHVYPKDSAERPYGFSTVNGWIKDHPYWHWQGKAKMDIKPHLIETAQSVIYVTSNFIP